MGRKRIDWRIYYGDGSTFDNTQGRPQDAPAWGVIVIAQCSQKFNTRYSHHWNYFYWNTGHQEWWGADLTGILDQFASFPDVVTALKIGRMVDTPTFDKLMLAARNDSSFVTKSAGKDPAERPD